MGAQGSPNTQLEGFVRNVEFLAKRPFGSLWGSSQLKNVSIAGVQEGPVTKFEKKVNIQAPFSFTVFAFIWDYLNTLGFAIWLLAGYTALKG